MRMRQTLSPLAALLGLLSLVGAAPPCLREADGELAGLEFSQSCQNQCADLPFAAVGPAQLTDNNNGFDVAAFYFGHQN